MDSAFDEFEAWVRGLLKDFPQMPATVIAERVGWSGSPSWFRKKVALLRPEYAPADPADRIVYSAGDQAQCDLWFPRVKIPISASQVAAPPVLVIVPSFSKFITARMIPIRTTADLLSGMWSLLSTQLGAVPRRLIWDNESGIGRRNNLAEGVTGFCGTLATKLQQLKAYDPESKGGVERANGYLETSFMPGRLFTSPADFNTQLLDWLPKANARTVRSLKARPIDLLEVDTAAMLRLPPVAPVHGFASRVRLPRDHLRVSGNDYSVDPSAIGRMVDVVADLEHVQVRFGAKVVADHGVQVTVPGQGTSNLKGKEALDYVRERHNLPNGDFDRVKRQQNFLRSILSKLVDRGTLTNPIKLTKTLDSVTKNLAVDDDWSSSGMRSLAIAMRNIRPGNVTFMTIPTKGTANDPIAGSIVVIDKGKSAELFKAMRDDDVDGFLADNPDTQLGNAQSVS